MTTGPSRLLAAARDGDEHAFETLWRGVQPGLSRYLRVVAPSAHAEAAPRVWIEVLHVLPRFRGGYSAWRISLYRTARAAGRGTFRTFGPRASRDARLAEAMTSAALVALAALPADLGETVALRYAAGLSLSEIAAVQRRPEAEVGAAVNLGTGIAAAIVRSPELRAAAERGRLPDPLPDPAAPDPHLLAALAAPASAAELAAWPEALAAFRAAVPVRTHHAPPVGKVGLDAPAPARPGGDGPRQPATGAPSTRHASRAAATGKSRPSATHVPRVDASPAPQATSHPTPSRSVRPRPTQPTQPTPSSHAAPSRTHPRSTTPPKPAAPPRNGKQPGSGTGHP